MFSKSTFSFPSTPVSYTHLDVYKRQLIICQKIFIYYFSLTIFYITLISILSIEFLFCYHYELSTNFQIALFYLPDIFCLLSIHKILFFFSVIPLSIQQKNPRNISFWGESCAWTQVPCGTIYINLVLFSYKLYLSLIHI